jgi:hypothetical protein
MIGGQPSGRAFTKERANMEKKIWLKSAANHGAWTLATITSRKKSGSASRRELVER